MDVKKFLQPKYLLFLFILFCLFFRTYKLEIFYTFEHDQDLYSWIVKDILIDHHLRLIGQLTSIDGVFIGPLFYYLLTPFYAIFNMNPLSAYIPILIISVLTVISIYYVFSTHFNKNAGLIGAFIYSVSVGSAFGDKWIVPTQPTILWSVWYLYALLSLIKGNFKVLPVVGLLVGLIWHIHIALIILLLPIPIAIFLSRKKISIKDLILPAILLLVFTLPFWLFEIRHNYQQINGLVKSISEDRGELKGIYRLEKELTVSSKAFLGPVLFYPTPPLVDYLSFLLIYLFLFFKKQISKKVSLVIFSWIGIVILAQFVSKRPLSEYYFSNLNIITTLFYSLLASFFYEQKRWKTFTKVVLISYFLFNLITMIRIPHYINGYSEKKKVVDFIANDSKNNKFPCIGVNYITQYGRGVGFRYLFWLSGIKVVNAGSDVPVYNIVIPDKRTESEINFGLFNIIKPEMKEFNNFNICNDPKKQLLPMLGFTK